MANPLAIYHRQFWDALKQHPELDKTLDRLFSVKGIPYDRWQELKHSLYCIGAVKFVNFDETRSAFTTWMVMWARALLRNYFRNSRGKLSPLADDLVESDLPELIGGGTAYDLVRDTNSVYRDRMDTTIAVCQVLKKYRENTRDFDTFAAVLDTMIVYGFDVTDAQIASEVDLTRQAVWMIRKQILSEIGTMLIRAGVDKAIG